MSDNRSKPSKKKTKITKGRKAKGRVDYDKQCGVINDKGLPCSRSLTCKAHSMGAKRAVQARSKAYDELLFEWNRANNPDWVDPLKVINVGHEIWAVAFSANGEYLLSGGDEGVRLWRAEDGEQMATRNVRCLAVSEDGKWVAAGTWVGGVSVWDAETCERVFSHREDSRDINAVDFSPDSTRLVSGSDNQKAIIWDIATHKRVQTLDHERPVFAAKYSSQGDRIATGTIGFVRVWDNDGHLLETMKVGVTPSSSGPTTTSLSYSTVK